MCRNFVEFAAYLRTTLPKSGTISTLQMVVQRRDGDGGGVGHEPAGAETHALEARRLRRLAAGPRSDPIRKPYKSQK